MGNVNADSAPRTPDETPGTATPGGGLEAGTYEVLRDRLAAAAGELTARAQALNARRLQTFGGTELALLAADRLRTGEACVPRDVVQVGGLLLFGHHPPATAGEPTAVADVFALHRRTGDRFEAAGPDALPGLLDDPRFIRDFDELHRYYRQARLLQLRRTGALLLAVFRTGERLTDIRVLRWQLAADGTPGYLDAKGERDHTFPPAHDLTWTPATREDHVPGRHPHIAVQGAVYVSTSGGVLTLKAEDDTGTADGIHTEPVDEPLQSLADAEVAHARVGPLILLRIRPYKESAHRYLVFNTRTRQACRLDGIGQACRALPEDQGIVFPGGYYLTTGTTKTFDTDTTDLEFERAVFSPNGEDLLYVFHARAAGRTLLLPYNVIREEAAAPLTAHGYALFDDGTMAVLRAQGDDPARVHPVQVWRTPFTSDAYAAAQPEGDGPLARIGNAELVRGISDALAVARMAAEMAPAGAVFAAIEAAATRAADGHHWLGEAELGTLAEPLEAVRATAAQVIDEFERVTELRVRAAQQLAEADTRTTALVRRVRGDQPGTADAWVRNLAELRHAQGHLATLREIRHIDLDRIDALSAALTDDLAATGRRAVAFLSGDDAFTATHRTVAELTAEAAAVPTVAEAAPLAERIDAQADGLRIVTEVVGTLDLADTTVRTSILARIGDVLGAVNRARATLDARRRTLAEAEGQEEFAAQFALLGQAVAGGLAAAATPEECDEQLGRLLLQVENLEARFGGLESSGAPEHGGAPPAQDDRLERIAAQREEIYEAFAARKQAQLDARARHTDRLVESARRVLATVTRRARALGTLDEVNAYFAADPLVAKVHATAGELRTLADPVRADELAGRLTAARQEAARALRDRADLYDETGTIRLGRHRFAVNTQPVDLTLVPYEGQLAFAVTGTDYRAVARDERLTADRAFWDQPLVSESPAVYRAEHLAALLLARAEAGEDALTVDALHTAAADGTLHTLVRGPPRPATTRATTAVSTTTTPPPCSPRCCGCARRPDCCASPRAPAPPPSSSGTTAPTPTPAPGGPPARTPWPAPAPTSAAPPRPATSPPSCPTRRPASWRPPDCSRTAPVPRLPDCRPSAATSSRNWPPAAPASPPAPPPARCSPASTVPWAAPRRPRSRSSPRTCGRSVPTGSPAPSTSPPATSWSPAGSARTPTPATPRARTSPRPSRSRCAAPHSPGARSTTRSAAPSKDCSAAIRGSRPTGHCRSASTSCSPGPTTSAPPASPPTAPTPAGAPNCWTPSAAASSWRATAPRSCRPSSATA